MVKMSYMVQNPGRGSKAVHHPCITRLPRRRGSVHRELILPRTWHTLKIPLSLEGKEGTGAEPATEAGRHLLAVALQLAASALHSAGGQLALGPETAFTKQFYSPIYSRYSSGERFIAIFPRETAK